MCPIGIMNRYRKMSCTEWVIQIKILEIKRKWKQTFPKIYKKNISTLDPIVIFAKIKEMSEIGFFV